MDLIIYSMAAVVTQSTRSIADIVPHEAGGSRNPQKGQFDD